LGEEESIDECLRCNLCGQEFDIEDDDDVLKERLLRHRERHNPEGKTASSNIIRGHCEFLVIGWENDNGIL